MEVELSCQDDTFSTSNSIEHEREHTIDQYRVEEIVESLEEKFLNDSSKTDPDANVIIPTAIDVSRHIYRRLKSPLLEYSSDDGSANLFSPEQTIMRRVSQDLNKDDSVSAKIHPIALTSSAVDETFIPNFCLDTYKTSGSNTSTIDCVNAAGKNALCIISSQCFLKGIKLFSNSGTDYCITCDSRQYNVLHLICEYTDNEKDLPHECLEYIIGISTADDLNLNLNQHGFDGKTALHLSAERGDYESTILLLINGADDSLLDENRNTPLHLASYGNHFACMKVLINYLDWPKDSTLQSVLNELSLDLDFTQFKVEESEQNTGILAHNQKNDLQYYDLNQYVPESNYQEVSTEQYNGTGDLSNSTIDNHLAVWNTFFENSTSSAHLTDKSAIRKTNWKASKRRKHKRRGRNCNWRGRLSDSEIINLVIQKGDNEYFRMLMDSQFDLYTTDEGGNTILHTASAHGNSSILLDILDFSGDDAWRLLSMKNDKSETATDVALRNKQQGCVEILSKFTDQQSTTLLPNHNITESVDMDLDSNKGNNSWSSLFGLFPVSLKQSVPPPPPIEIDTDKRSSRILSP